MTIDKAQAEFNKLIAENGFTVAGRTGDTGLLIYHRIWKDGSEKLEVRMMLSTVYTLVTVKKNGAIDGDIVRDYDSTKRAMNAIRIIVNNNGFDI